MLLSVEHEANESSVRQSTSSTGARCMLNFCLAAPVARSNTLTVWSTLPLSNRSPFLFHLRAKIAPWCSCSVCCSWPLLPQTRAMPSQLPVASAVPSGVQSRVVTSLLLWSSSTNVGCGPPTFQMRAVWSPEPEASKGLAGHQEQMKTSLRWPSSRVTWESGTSGTRSSSWSGALAAASWWERWRSRRAWRRERNHERRKKGKKSFCKCLEILRERSICEFPDPKVEGKSLKPGVPPSAVAGRGV